MLVKLFYVFSETTPKATEYPRRNRTHKDGYTPHRVRIILPPEHQMSTTRKSRESRSHWLIQMQRGNPRL